jgi:hypothetical protein
MKKRIPVPDGYIPRLESKERECWKFKGKWFLIKSNRQNMTDLFLAVNFFFLMATAYYLLAVGLSIILSLSLSFLSLKRNYNCDKIFLTEQVFNQKKK